MAIDTELKYARLDELSLDPLNARLGRNNTGRDVPQPRVLELMKDWELEELALSFLESGFWTQEALLVTRETLYGKLALVVVEGNRRLAALTYLQSALKGKPASRKWAQLVDGAQPPPHLFSRIPYLLIGSRKEIESYLGFRHVTGIKEWKPAEKAEYIARLIEDSHMSYEDVRRRIGSKTPAVRQHYIAYRLLRQMEEQENISLKYVEEKFSVLYLSLRTAGAQRYLAIDIKAEPKAARRPVPQSRLKPLSRFALWLFGDGKTPPLVKESRQVDDFGVILGSRRAVEYLERSDRPSFDMAFQLAGGDEPEVIKLIEKAADNLELALSRAHLYVKSNQLRLAVDRLAADAAQVVRLFPEIEKKLAKGDEYMLALPERGFARSVEAHNVNLDVLVDWIEASLLFQEEPVVAGAQVVDLLCEAQVYASQAFAWERVDDAWAEFRRRQDCLNGYSPFVIEPARLTRRVEWRETPVHSLCLVLSLAKWYPKWAQQFGKDHTEQGELFELVTRASLESLLGGWRFHGTGWTRTRTNKLGAVVREVAALLGETIGRIERWTRPQANEAGLDLLCYRPFADARVGVPVYLMQCASGGDWEGKLHTPRLEVWRRLVEFAATPRKAFSTPFAFSDDDFVRNCVLVDGLLMDRYRLLSAGRENPGWITPALQARLIAWQEPRVAQLPQGQEVL